MTYSRTFEEETATRVRIAHDPEGLSFVRAPNCAAAIWHRTPLPQFQSWIDGLPPENLPRAKMLLRPEQVHDALSHLMNVCGTPGGDERDMLVDDGAALALVFAKIMRAEYLRLRLNVVSQNPDQGFDQDAVTARLICTYRGTGTQYGVAPQEAAPPQVFTVPTCAPIVLRGALWPGHQKSAVLHRAPSFQDAAETRLVLDLEPVTEPESPRSHAPLTFH